MSERRAVRILRDVVRDGAISHDSDRFVAQPTLVQSLAEALALLAVLQVAGALIYSVSGWRPGEELTSPFSHWQRATMVICATGGIALRIGAGSNGAVAALAAVYLGVSAAFVGSLIGQLTPSDDHWQRAAVGFLRWPTDLALPAGIWAFVVCFPPLEPAARLQRVTSSAGAAAAVIILCVFAANVIAPHLHGQFPPLDRLLAAVNRRELQSHYTPLFFALFATAVPFGLARLGYGYVRAKREVRRLFLALSAGFAPVAVLSTIGASSQAGAAFLTQPRVLPAATFAVFAGLWSLPFSTGAALLSDRVLHLQPVLRASVRYATSQWILTLAIVLPLAVCVYLALRDRAATIDAFLAAGGAAWLGVSAGSLILATFRTQITQSIDRVFSRRIPDVRNLITTLASGARRQPSAKRVAELLADAIRHTSTARSVAIVVREQSSDILLPIVGDMPPISMDSAIATLLSSSNRAVDLRDRSAANIAMLLPEAELSVLSECWLLIPLHAEGDELVGAVCVAEPSATDRYSQDDVETLPALCAAAGQALGQRLGAGSDVAPTSRAAQECDRCGELADALGRTCRCGGVLVGSSLPRQLGRFTILRRVGRGGMGVVYQARDEALNRVVALKALPEVTSEERTRLQHEARVMANLQHSGIASVFGLEMFRAMPVLVMEYFAGGTLQNRLQHGAFSASEVAALCMRLADGLSHIHAAGLLHRDLKPSNVGFTSHNQPKIFDFGIAERADVDDVTAAGTLLYLAPESASGGTFSAASDIWALAVVICEVWLGRHPAVDLPHREQIALIRSGRLWEHASQICPREPLQFRAALAYALTPDVARRCPSASDFARIIAPTHTQLV